LTSVNEFVYEHLNNGVYRTGFAATQAAYDEAVEKVFAGSTRSSSASRAGATWSGTR